MNVPRAALSTALFNLIAAVPPPGYSTWNKAERGATPIGEVAPADQPYFGLICPTEDVQQQQLGLRVYDRHYVAIFYLRRDATPMPDGTYFTDILEQFIDSIDEALDTGIPPNTLGGLTASASIEGTVLVDPATLDQQAWIQIPIRVIAGI
jgi:hypothetical protein